MSWRERGYSESVFDRVFAPLGGPRWPPPITLFLMVFHGVLYFLMLALREGADAATLQRMVLGPERLDPLGVFLHPIASPNLLTVIFTVLVVWSLGRRLEPLIGSLHMALLYLLLNPLAGLGFVIVGTLRPELAGAELDYPVGFLAGLCLGAWRELRDFPVQVFGRRTTIGRLYAICGLIVVGLVALRSGLGAVGFAVAVLVGIGGAEVLLWLRNWRTLRRLTRRSPAAHRRRSHMRPAVPDVDDILAKISRAGIDALSEDERRRLDEARAARQRRDD